ncbi:MAG: ECF transporter S component [Candidatus Sifarchaeia archaeon]
MELFRPKTKNTTLFVALVVVLTALTTVATIIIAVPFPTSTGFLNFGDTLVMLSGLLLGPLGGFFAGGVGSAMGDVALGYIHFAPITFIVKGCEGMIVGFASRKVGMANRLTRIDVVGLIVASLVMMFGYFIAEIFLFLFLGSSFLVALWTAFAELITLNWIQVTVGSIIAALTGPSIRGFLRDYIHEEETMDSRLEKDVHQSTELA